MVFFNHATRQMTAKIVYYGPGLCGKTTNLNAIYAKTSQRARGEMVSLNTETDRTLFFDLLPMDVGTIGGFKTKLQLYTVPGQVFYNSTRKLVLKGVDGIVFVADSQTPMLDANRESLQNLRDNLRELGLDLSAIPMVFQWNKRDLKHVSPLDELERELNPSGRPSFQSVAQDGTGVFETLRGITRLALGHIKTQHLADLSDSGVTAEPPPAQAAPKPVVIAPVPGPDALRMEDLEAPVTGLAHSDLQVPRELDESALPEVDTLPTQIGVPPVAVPPPIPSPGLSPAPIVPAVPPAPLSMPHLAPMAAPAIRPVAPKPVVPKPTMPGVSLALPQINVKPKVAPAPIPKALAPHIALPVAASLRVNLPAVSDGQELEVVVQVRSGGQILAEESVSRTAPGVGSALKVSVEVRRG